MGYIKRQLQLIENGGKTVNLEMGFSHRQDLSLGQEMRLTQRLAQSLKLSLAQRMLLHGHTFGRRMELLESLREEKYEPKALCPSCGRNLKPEEIIHGFRRDPQDYTTGCPKCKHRFEPLLICFGHGSSIELPFFCDNQTLCQLRGKEHLSPAELDREHPAIYRSAIVHHGGLHRAFEKIGAAYPFEEIHDWKAKVIPFLGRLTDVTIASAANVPPVTIRRLRREMKISRFTIRKALREARRRKKS